jgi:hypothetical protein
MNHKFHICFNCEIKLNIALASIFWGIFIQSYNYDLNKGKDVQQSTGLLHQTDLFTTSVVCSIVSNMCIFIANKEKHASA